MPVGESEGAVKNMRDIIFEKDSKLLIGLLCILVILPLLLLRLISTAELQSYTFSRLGDAAMQQSVTIRARIDGQYSTLDSLACQLSRMKSNGASDADIVTVLEDEVSLGEFYMLGLSSTDGRAVLSTGDTTNIAERGYFQRSLTGERALERVENSVLHGWQRIILSVPVKYGDKVIGVLHGSFEPEIFSELLITSMFHNTANSYLCDSSGNIIVRHMVAADLTEDAATFYDLLDENALQDKTMEHIQAGLSGNASEFFLNVNGQKRYISMTPFGINDWVLVNAIPRSSVDKANATLRWTIMITVFITLCGVVFIIFFLSRHERRRTQQLQHEKELLRQSRESYALVNALSDSVLFFGDLKEDSFAFNSNYHDIFGQEPFCKRLSDFNRVNPRIFPEDVEAYYGLGRDMTDGVGQAEAEFRVIDTEGNTRWQKMEYMTVEDETGVPTRIIGKLSNIDRQKEDLARLQKLAESDPLTELENRNAMQKKIDRFLGDTENAEAMHAFIMIDVDDFKMVNDTKGHQQGDAVLQAYAKRMRSLFRKTDIIGRMGGDEFVVFAKNVGSVEGIHDKAAMLSSPIRLKDADGNEEIAATCSIGIAISPAAGQTFDTLYLSADKALYAAKQTGKNKYMLYNESMKKS